MIGPESSRAVRLRLADDVGLRVLYADDTRFGSAVSGRCELECHKRLAVLHAYREKFGLQQLIREAPAVLGRVVPEAWAGIRASATRLNEDWLHPAPALVRPAYLRVERNVTDIVAQFELSPVVAADLASWIGEWQRGAGAPAAPAARALWEGLAACGALVAAETGRMAAPLDGVRFLGHAMIAIGDGARRLLVDPYVVPHSACYPPDWQPPSFAALGRPDAVFITHSHPDHFDPGTLLRFGSEVPIHVPAVARESVLAIDMAARLAELGFRDVRAHTPWQRIDAGTMRVTTLPFHGEQPTTGEVLHPEVRNVGLTYAIERGGHRYGVFADGGLDGQGDIRAIAATARERHGAFDTVFGGYRGFAIYPVQYLFSSVSRFLPFVPPALWGVRQQIMCDADGLIDLGECAGAKRVVPYADGGAPWYWLRGLGPNLDSHAPAAMATDPPPTHVADVARRRAHTLRDGPLASPVAVDVLEVGAELSGDGSSA